MRSVYTILSVLMIIGGIVSAIVYTFATAFSSFIAAAGGNGTFLILYPVLALIAGIFECAAGIFGARAVYKRQRSVVAFVLGAVTVALNVAVILVALLPLHAYVPWYTWVLSLCVPVLFTASAVIVK